MHRGKRRVVTVQDLLESGYPKQTERSCEVGSVSAEEVEYLAQKLQYPGGTFDSAGYQLAAYDNALTAGRSLLIDQLTCRPATREGIRKAFLTEPLWRRAIGWLTLRPLRHWILRKYLSVTYR
jgi:hypothetical protein